MVSTGSCYSVNKMPNNTNEGAGVKEKPAFRDVRRYYWQYCGICRSKKNLIRSHIVASHKFELEETQSDEVEGINKVDCVMQHACQECGASFRKPAHMKQHMLSHCIERPFSCPVDDCHASYRRKDQLTLPLIDAPRRTFHFPC
ncbi:unnamed protein product [Musa hybrid cultivar]